MSLERAMGLDLAVAAMRSMLLLLLLLLLALWAAAAAEANRLHGSDRRRGGSRRGKQT